MSQASPRLKAEQAVFQQNTHILDDVQGYFEIPARIQPIIDTPHFQRLRGLKQLGTTYYVFPGASHNRFEHSLGVMHLAGRLIEHLASKQPELNITDSDKFCVRAAGLLHDLGHGPFSHVFDHEFVPIARQSLLKPSHTSTSSSSSSHLTGQSDDKSQEEKESDTDADADAPVFKSLKKFRHEDMSVRLIQDLFETNKIPIDKEELELIQALVSPSTHPDIVEHYREKKKHFLFQIVANDESGVDVDKWDYIARDSYNVNLGVSFNKDRLLAHCRVIDDTICWESKTSFGLENLFRARYNLFKRVYSHKTSKAIEYMICDALLLANGVFRIVDKIETPTGFLQLKDSIIDTIEGFDPGILPQNTPQDKMRVENLKKSQDLIKRIRHRDLYKCCGMMLFTDKTLKGVIEQLEKKMNTTVPHVQRSDSNSSATTTNSSLIIERTPTTSTARNGMHCDDDTDSSETEEEYISVKFKYKAAEELFRKRWLQIIRTRHPLESQDIQDSDIIIQLMSLSYGMEDAHPISRLFLYNKSTPFKKNSVHPKQISKLSGSSFREIIFRAYVKSAKLQKFGKEICREFLEAENLISHSEQDFDISLSPLTTRFKSRRLTKEHNGTPHGSSDTPVANLFNTSPPAIGRKRSRSESSSSDVMPTSQTEDDPLEPPCTRQRTS